MKISRAWLLLSTCFAIMLSSEALPTYVELVLKRFPLRTREQFLTNTLNKLSTSVANTKDTLVSVAIVFRHGNRVPDATFVYPNNPYKEESFLPYNFGDLTLKGQKTMYDRGAELRKRYASFLGAEYFNNLVESVSSSYRRCQMSLQSLHTGLFGGLNAVPVKNIAWQAVPYVVIPPKEDNLISVQLACPLTFQNVKYPLNQTDAKEPETLKVFDLLRKYSGFKSVGYREASLVYDFIKTSSEQGLEVPKEFAEIYPEPLRTVAMRDWDIVTKQTVPMVAPLLDRITQQAIAKTSSSLATGPAERKMFLYAGHDLNIYYILQALKVFDGSEINYGAYVAFELHNIQGTYGFKVFLQNGVKKFGKVDVLDIPDCGTFCPLSYFVELVNNLKQEKMICN